MRRFAVLLIAGAFLTACSRPGIQASAPLQPILSSPVLAPAAQQTPYEPGPNHQLALKLIGGEDYPGAEVALRQVVAAEPQVAEAWNDLSLVQAKLGRFRDAAESAKQALALKPGFTFAEFNLGAALLQTSDGWREAKPHLEASASVQPDRPEPLYALGLWYKYAGDLGQARAMLQKAANMNYGPARGDLVSLDKHVSQSAATGQVVARFPEAPVQVIWDLMQGYVQQGYTRRIEQVIPVRLRRTGETSWAALLREESKSGIRTSLQVQATDPLDDYLGSCQIPGSGAVDLRVVDYGGGQHVLITTEGRTLVCGLKDRFVEVLFSASTPVSVAADGLMVGGTLHRFILETSQYLPATVGEKAAALIADLRAAGFNVETDTAVLASLDLGKGGGPGLAFAWNGGVAFKPEGGSVSVYGFKGAPKEYRTLYPYPHQVGKVTVSGHVFLAVQTLQPGGPNGADVLVLEYDIASKNLRPVFSAGSDGAGFTENSVSTAFKRYLPQGGFEVYVTEYTWDEQKYTFMPGKTTKAEK